MPKKRGEIEQSRHRVNALAIPAQQRPHRERMPKTVQVRCPHPRRNREMKCGQKFMEGPADSVRPYWCPCAFGEGEHWAIGRNRPETRLLSLQEGRYCCGHA